MSNKPASCFPFCFVSSIVFLDLAGFVEITELTSALLEVIALLVVPIWTLYLLNYLATALATNK